MRTVFNCLYPILHLNSTQSDYSSLQTFVYSYFHQERGLYWLITITRPILLPKRQLFHSQLLIRCSSPIHRLLLLFLKIPSHDLILVATNVRSMTNLAIPLFGVGIGSITPSNLTTYHKPSLP
ncbi:hypothetical protein Dimus_038696 [Dionaea muscipula]